MKPLFILLVQSATGSVIFMVLLLLVAGVIGYFTAWFYAKSVYTPIIKGLEEDKAELNRQIVVLKDKINQLNGTINSLNATVSKLNDTVDKLNEKIGKLEESIAEKDKEIMKLKDKKEK